MMKEPDQTQPYYRPAETRPIVPPENLSQFQTIRVPTPPAKQNRRKSSGCGTCALILLIPLLVACVVFTGYLLAPFPTSLLVMGIDRVPDGTALGRSDTMIIVSVNPLQPVVKMLSIPRDLWVTIPNVGENRINTAHFFAEANQPGSGPQATLDTIEQNFQVKIPYYVRIRFDAFQQIIDALGGVTVNLPSDMGGLTAGEHHLTGEQALAFVRDRKGADDFFRMEHGQLMLKSVVSEAISPGSWNRYPQVASAIAASVDTNLPVWQWPRLGLAVLRAVVGNSIDSSTISREMTSSYITSGGADVLLPNWDVIRPYVKNMLGQ